MRISVFLLVLAEVLAFVWLQYASRTWRTDSHEAPTRFLYTWGYPLPYYEFEEWNGSASETFDRNHYKQITLREYARLYSEKFHSSMVESHERWLLKEILADGAILFIIVCATFAAPNFLLRSRGKDRANFDPPHSPARPSESKGE